jgi:HD-GYP domain-containing protein (c-di-GMP phosphodiesterase class II)
MDAAGGAADTEIWAAQLVRAADSHDDYGARHSESVGVLARQVGVRVGMDADQLRLLELAAWLRDVGKIGLPGETLNKPGPLDESEWQLLRRHAALGAETLAARPGLERPASFVRWHHEHWDGGGYPDGLAGHEIPLASRVIAACDSLRAMTAERPYRAALTFDEAIGELVAGAGSQYDANVVAVLADGHHAARGAARALPDRTM